MVFSSWKEVVGEPDVTDTDNRFVSGTILTLTVPSKEPFSSRSATFFFSTSLSSTVLNTSAILWVWLRFAYAPVLLSFADTTNVVEDLNSG